MAKINGQEEDRPEFTIKHFFEGAEEGRGPIKPALGRMNLSESLNPLKGLEKLFA